MEGRMFGLETPLMIALQHLLDIPDGEKQGSTGAGGPTRAYVRDARAMAATPADVKELLGAYAFVVDMPGLGSGDLKVEDEWVLVVSGERRSEREAERARGGDGAGSGEGLPRQARIAGPASAGALPTGVDSRITEEEAIAGEKSSPKARQQEQAAEETEKKMKAKMEELKVLRSKKAEMDARVASLEKELAAAVAKRVDLEVAAKAFDAEKIEIVKELEGLKRKVEEIQLTQSGKFRDEDNNNTW